MPLKKGKSFFKPMSNMFIMLKRVAIGAKNFKIENFIVISISIFVMNAQNFWHSIIPTSFTRFYHFASNHIFSYRLECGNPFFFFGFVNAGNATKTFCLRRTCLKKFSTMSTWAANRSFCALRFVIAPSAAILCFIESGRYVAKNSTTNLTVCSNLNSSGERLARTRAVLKSLKSVFGNVDKFLTVPARNVFSCKEL
jgi:hypothetical protein